MAHFLDPPVEILAIILLFFPQLLLPFLVKVEENLYRVNEGLEC